MIGEIFAELGVGEDRRRKGSEKMRSILLYVIGIPIPIILLIALCTHHF